MEIIDEPPSALLRRARLGLGLSAAAVAKRAQVGHSYLIAVERGRRPFPSPPVLERILKGMGATDAVQQEIQFAAAVRASALYQDPEEREHERPARVDRLVRQLRRLRQDELRAVELLVARLGSAHAAQETLNRREAAM